MEPKENADKGKEVVPAATEKTTEPTQTDNPIEKELEKVSKKGKGRTRKEKLIYTKNRIERELSELDEEEGVEPSVEEVDENAPVTVGMLKKIEAEKATKTAISLADDIEDEHERELVIHHLNNTIKSTGNPTEDLKLARTLVNSVKNSQILEEAARKGEGRNSSKPGAPAKPSEGIFEPTAEEAALMRPPFSLTKEEVLKARKKSQN